MGVLIATSSLRNVWNNKNKCTRQQEAKYETTIPACSWNAGSSKTKGLRKKNDTLGQLRSGCLG